MNVEEAILARSTADLSNDIVVDFSFVAKGPGTEIDSVEFQASVRWRHGDMLVCSFWKNRIWAAIHQMIETSTDAVSCKIKGLVPAIRPPWFVGFETRRFCLGLHAYIRITTRQGLYPAERERITPTFRIQFDRRYCTRRRRRSSRFSCDEVLEVMVDSHYACSLHKARRRRLRAWLAYEIHVR